jgi:ketosteroid isomerase-like protein
MRLGAFAAAALLVVSVRAAHAKPPTPQDDVGAVLDAWHAAAAAADEGRYFSHLTPDAVFLGTDGKERWTRDQFREWAKPHFAARKTWTFKARERHVAVGAEGTVAWFDEVLETANLGRCRGSGVLVRTRQGWKIAQYNLSLPIPNEIVDEVVKRIAATR